MKLGISSILTIIFVIAKIMGYLNWSWLWIFSPLWIAFLLILVLAVIEVLLTR